MEQEKKIKEYIERITTPVFNKVLKEIQSKPMRVGKDNNSQYQFCLIQPHNYRRYYDFSPKNINPTTLLKEPKSRVTYSLKNHNSEHHIDNYCNCRIVIRKKTIEIINKIDHKRWYPIDMYRAEETIKRIIKQKELECVAVLKSLIKDIGGKTTFTLIKHREETKVKRNPITDKINTNLTWHTSDHKKVYYEKNVEIYDINKAIQLIDNSIFYDNTQEIAMPLKSLALAIQKLLPKPLLTLEELKIKIQTKQDIYKYLKDIKELNQDEEFLLNKYIIEELKLFGD